jgi:uncharacterized protein
MMVFAGRYFLEHNMKLNQQISALVLMICLVTGLAAPGLAEEKSGSYLEVTGIGSASGQPDMAMLSLTVLRTGKTAREALDANNTAMASVLTGMAASGIAKPDLQTSGFSMQPRYTYPKPDRNGQRPAPVLTGYVVSNQLSVRVRDLEQVGLTLDEAVSLGANKIGNIRFQIENADKLQGVARTRAMKNALTKAVTLARAGGIPLGSIIQVREHTGSPRPKSMMLAQRVEMGSPASVPVAAGEVTFSVNVVVRWSLQPLTGSE